MNILLFVFLLSFGHHAPPAHDVAIAMFRISQSEGELSLDITLDVEDLASVLGLAQKDIKLANIQTYIDQHTQFEFDNKQNEVSLIDFEIVRDHFLIQGSFHNKLNTLENIQIYNTCLISIPNHSNIIQVQLNGALRDFRMHKKRTSVTVTY